MSYIPYTRRMYKVSRCKQHNIHVHFDITQNSLNQICLFSLPSKHSWFYCSQIVLCIIIPKEKMTQSTIVRFKVSTLLFMIYSMYWSYSVISFFSGGFAYLSSKGVFVKFNWLTWSNLWATVYIDFPFPSSEGYLFTLVRSRNDDFLSSYNDFYFLVITTYLIITTFYLLTTTLISC